MANPVPNALSLNVIQNGTLGDATPVESNFAAIQTAVNQLRACLANGTAGQLLSAVDGTDVQWINNITYRKTTAKQVVNTITETDLLNGEITVGAGVLGTNGVLRLTAWGDAVNNSGVGQNFPRFKAKLGGTTLLDSGVTNQWSTSAARFMWRVQFEIMNLGAANSQWSTLIQEVGGPNVAATAAAGATTGEGNINLQATLNQGRALVANSSAVDTTVAQSLAYTVTLPVANASLDWTLKGALVEIV